MRWRRHGLVWPPTVLLLSVWAMLGLGACGDDDPVADASGADTTVDQTLDTMPDGPAIPVPTDAPIKGPWVLQVDTDSALIRWQSELMPETAAIEYGPVDGTERQTATGSSVATEVTVGWDERGTFTTPDPVGTFYLTDVQIEGLAPATCYEWSVVGHQENLGRFCTMHEATDHDTPISIFVVGDTSPGLTLTQVLVDQFMVEEPEFTVHVGDLQYYSVIIETWQLWFDTMQPLLSAGAMFPCIGNHEDEL
ncbi:MAG: metallophosphoesterase family protein, partial [Myxococcota bacterium]